MPTLFQSTLIHLKIVLLKKLFKVLVILSIHGIVPGYNQSHEINITRLPGTSILKTLFFK